MRAPPGAVWSACAPASPKRMPSSSATPTCRCTKSATVFRSSIPAAQPSAVALRTARWVRRPYGGTKSSFASCPCHDHLMRARAVIAVSTLALVALAGCGSSGGKDDTTIAGGAEPANVQVIKRWADELRAGDVSAASERFALPTVIQNGTPPLQLTDRRENRAVHPFPPLRA